jgi:hypothetical protein
MTVEAKGLPSGEVSKWIGLVTVPIRLTELASLGWKGISVGLGNLDLDLRVVVEYRRRSNKEELDEEEEDQTRRKEFISQNLSKTLSQWRVETQYSLYVSLFFLKLMLFFLQITKFNTIIICHFFLCHF